MARTSSRQIRGRASRRNRALKLAAAILVGLGALLALNAFVLDQETDSASVNVTDGQLVNTTSGQIQVVDTPPVPPDPSVGGGASGPRPGVASPALPAAPPIVLIHGSGGAIDWWDELTPLLAEQGRRVIALDMLGYGGSDKPASGYSIESQAGLVAQVLAKLDVERAAVVGHSLGGRVATALAEGSPALVSGVAIIDTAPDSSYGGLSGTARAAQVPVLGQALWRVVPDFMVRRNLETAFAPGFEVPDGFVDDVRAMTYPAYSDSAEESESYADQMPLDQRLEELGLPLLVIFGEQDRLYDAREAISAYAPIPGVETVLIPEAGHSPNVETPEKSAAILGRFVNALAPESPGPAPTDDGSRNGGGQGDDGGNGRGQGGNGDGPQQGQGSGKPSQGGKRNPGQGGGNSGQG